MIKNTLKKFTPSSKFERKGNSKNEPLVFLHGLGVPPKHYNALLTQLAEKYFVIAPIAYGINCFKPQPTTIQEYAEATNDFINTLQLENSHLVGHSLGGAEAIVSASQNNDISDVIAINPLLPINYTIGGFILRSLKKTTQQIIYNPSLTVY